MTRWTTQHGTPGEDKIIGTEGDDVLVGRGGPDIIIGKGGNDRICGRSGIDFLRKGVGDDLVSGGRGSDDLAGGPGRDRLFGGRGSDEVNGYCDDDFISGGGGYDRSRFGLCASSELTAFNISLRTGIAAADGIDTLFSVESVYAGVDGGPSTVLEGNRKNNYLVTGPGDDQIFGRGGDDWLDGQGGVNSNDGGPGWDICEKPWLGQAGATNCEESGP